MNKNLDEHGEPWHVLLTGATGYVGGRLLGHLEAAGYAVRCLVRRPEVMEGRTGPQTEVVQGDLLDAASMRETMQGMDVAFYLVHSLGEGADFEEEELRAARNFAEAASAAGVKRIIYLGGLGDDRPDLSPHLRSRHKVGEALRQSGVTVVEFRASIIIGSGSLSFEIVRALVQRLPVMVTPRWVSVPAQPIHIDDVLKYLLEAIEIDLPGSAVFEIGGRDVVTYGEIMREYARQRGVRRYFVPVPVLTPRLSSWWLNLVTPAYATVGRKLIDSIRHPTTVQDHTAQTVFTVDPIGVNEAIERALRNEDQEFVSTHWAGAASSVGNKKSWGGVRFRSRIIDSREKMVPVTPEEAFTPIKVIGGGTGWYYGNWLWALRGLIDRLVGGVGLRRGRRDRYDLRVGDVVDWWRVEAYEPGKRLLLQAEMRVPGRAWLEFVVEPLDDGGSLIRQTALYDPVGLVGLAYWYALYPLHQFVFAGMLNGIAASATAAKNGARETLIVG